MDVEAKKLELKQAKFDARQARYAKEWDEKMAMKSREMDLRYLESLVLVILLILIIYFMSCRFGFGLGNKAESFSPYASILGPDQPRSDAAFDYAQNMPYKDPDWEAVSNLDFNGNAQQYRSEDRLFQQTHDLRM